MNFENLKMAQGLTLQQIEEESWRLVFVFCKGALGATAAILQLVVIVFLFFIHNAAVAAVRFSQFVIDWNPVKPAAFGRKEKELIV